jgi:HSP20 family protein
MSETATVPVKSEAPKVRRWDPNDRLTQALSDIEQFWGGHLPLLRPLRRLGEMPGLWSPRVDVYEQNGNIVVKAELPGMTKDAIDIAVEDGDLVIRGERKSEETVEEKDYYRMERSSGSFYRRVPLPEGTTLESIEATYADGVLEVKAPKLEPKTPETKKIVIK